MTVTINDINYNFDTGIINPDDYIVFACAKNEGLYIKEWVDHYLALGFDKIILANNDNDQTVLNNELTDYLGSKVFIFDCNGIVDLQIPLYSALVKEGNYKWCAYFDIDEFLEINCQHQNIKDLLDSINEDVFCVNWMMFGSNDNLIRKDGTVQERFLYPKSPVGLYKENLFIKSIVRGHLDKEIYFNNPHYPSGNGIIYSYGGLKTSDKIGQTIDDIYYNKVCLKHYYTKSLEEYLNKIKRGRADCGSLYYDSSERYDLLNNNTKLLISDYSNTLFGDNTEESWMKDYKLYCLMSSSGNQYGLLLTASRIMNMNKDCYILIDDIINPHFFSILLEFRFQKNIKIITCHNDNNTISGVINRILDKIKSEFYYIINI